MSETKPEFVYPPGHNWGGLTLAQVNEAYARNTGATKLQDQMMAEPGKEVRFEILAPEVKSVH